MILPSLPGFRPRSELRIAFSISSDQGRIPGLDGDHERFRHMQRTDLVERRRRAEIIDPDAVKKVHGCPAGANVAHGMLQIRQNLFHPALSVVFNVFDCFLLSCWSRLFFHG